MGTKAQYKSMIRNTLKNKNSKQRANLKGREIAKIRKVRKTKRAKNHIQIVDTKKIEGGIEVFARCWDKKGKQIGFGVDGSVDVERFRIFNPPILVADPQGDIVREWIEGRDTKREQRFREDPKEALLQVIEHNLSVMKNIHSDERIVKGKIGNTTSTFYPDAHTESTSVDGIVRRDLGASGGDDWTTIRNGAGNGSSDAGSAINLFRFEGSNNSSTEWDLIARSIVLFDTSALGDSDTITGATLSFYVTSKADPFSDTPALAIVDSTPASNTALVAADYGQVGTTRQASDTAYGDITASEYNDITLNSTGEASISKTGITKLGTRCDLDLDDIDPNTHGSRDNTQVQASSADVSGTTQDPKLVVEHSSVVNISVSPAAQVATFSVPTYAAKTGLSVAAAAQIATFSLPTYSVATGLSVSPAAQVATFTVPTYTVDLPDVTFLPSALVATFTVPTYSVKRGWVIAQGVPPVATFSIPTYTLKFGQTQNPATQVATFTVPAYSVLFDHTVSVAAQVATFSIPAYSLTAQTLVTPSAVVATFTIPAYAIAFGIVVSPDTQVLTFSLPSLLHFGAVWEKTARPTDSTWGRATRNST